MQVLGAAAELERALIRERTKARLAGSQSQRPCRRQSRSAAPEPKAIRHAAVIRDAPYFAELNLSASGWLPVVRQLRPDHSWSTVVRVLNGRGRSGTLDHRTAGESREALRPRGACRQGTARSRAEAHESRPCGDPDIGYRPGQPDAVARAIGAQLDAMRVKPPRGGERWSALVCAKPAAASAAARAHDFEAPLLFQPGSSMPTTGS